MRIPDPFAMSFLEKRAGRRKGAFPTNRTQRLLLAREVDELPRSCIAAEIGEAVALLVSIELENYALYPASKPSLPANSASRHLTASPITTTLSPKSDSSSTRPRTDT